MVPGRTVALPEDKRPAILLEPGERAFVLTEMRGFLTGVQAIAAGVSANDAAAIAKAARAQGMGAVHEVPAGLMTKLPMAFKQLGLSVHQDFDRLALDAENFGDPKLALTQLSAVLNKCIVCHSAYQLAAPAPTAGR
jgi:hypothetical protein